uniref:Lipase maturation factor 2 n=2 Tax=Caenorhabditis tropicalis TaxID=1561998 RepID=A0A1I7SXD0_9PELO
MQMHLASEGTYQQNPFFLSLVYHLMENTTEVVELIHSYPFKNRSEPMKFARAKLYMYHFTNKTERGWWKRDYQEEYMPVFNKGNQALLDYLTERRIITKKKSKFINGPLGIYLRRWHRLTKGLDAFSFLFTFAIFLIVKAIHQWFYPHHFHPFND